jgi:hypothetical protein
MTYRDAGNPGDDCPSSIAWHAEYQRAALLLELLAEDHFPDQVTFDEWTNRQMGLALRRASPPPEKP